MTKNGKLPIAIAPLAIAVLLVLIAGRLYADPLLNSSSPQSDVTRGKIESDADYFMSVRNYANMDFDKWWGVVSYKYNRSTENKIYTSSQLAQFGFAARFDGLYTALSYRGSGLFELGKWSGGSGSVFSHTEQTVDGKTWNVFNSLPRLDYRSGGGPGLLNEGSLLFGFADMGIRLYYTTNYQSNSATDYRVGTTYYKSWYEEYGHINPGITWGMTRELIPGLGIKPQVNIDLDFFREKQMEEAFVNPAEPGETEGTRILFSRNKFVPGLDLGLGAITLARIDNFSLDVDLDYSLKLHLYENDYDYMGDDGRYQTKTLKGGLRETLDTVVDIFEIKHWLTPKISAGWSGDRLRLACRLGVPMTLYTKNETAKRVIPGNTDGLLERNGYDNSTTVYTLNPVLDLAMQWEIIPSRLFLNAGGKLGIFETSFTTQDRNEYENDQVKADFQSYKQINNSFVSASTVLYLGITFNLMPSMKLQAAMGVDSNTINVFSASASYNDQGDFQGGFFSFGNILLTLQF